MVTIQPTNMAKGRANQRYNESKLLGINMDKKMGPKHRFGSTHHDSPQAPSQTIAPACWPSLPPAQQSFANGVWGIPSEGKQINWRRLSCHEMSPSQFTCFGGIGQNTGGGRQGDWLGPQPRSRQICVQKPRWWRNAALTYLFRCLAKKKMTIHRF